MNIDFRKDLKVFLAAGCILGLSFTPMLNIMRSYSNRIGFFEIVVFSFYCAILMFIVYFISKYIPLRILVLFGVGGYIFAFIKAYFLIAAR